MRISRVSQAMRDAFEMQSCAARFYGRLTHHAADRQTRKFFVDMVRIEQMLALEVETMASQLCDEPWPEHSTPQADQRKTAPEWLHVKGLTLDVALAITLDCTRRAGDHCAAIADALQEPAAAFFRSMASGDDDHARLIEGALAARLRSRASLTPAQEAVLESLASIRRSGEHYAVLQRRAARESVRSFFGGMVEVCALHAGDFERMAWHALGEPVVQQPDDTQPVAGLWADRSDDMSLEEALRLAMHAEKRAALHHGMLAHTYRGPVADVYLHVADAERRHAATIGAVLDRVAQPAPHLTRDLDAVSPLVDALRMSWTAPADTTVRSNAAAEETIPPQGLRLVVG